MDPVELYEKSTAWTAEKIANLTPEQLKSETCCEEWDVRSLINHCLAAQKMFAGAARGEQVTGPPQGPPPDLVGDDPGAEYARLRDDALTAFREPGGAEKAGPIVGIGFIDQLIHGWDLAKASGQDPTMPEGLADAAMSMIGGRLTDDNRGPGKPFKAEVPVSDDASAQDKLLGYSGRQP